MQADANKDGSHRTNTLCGLTPALNCACYLSYQVLGALSMLRKYSLALREPP